MAWPLLFVCLLGLPVPAGTVMTQKIGADSRSISVETDRQKTGIYSDQPKNAPTLLEPPVYGQIRLGAFAGEAAEVAGIRETSVQGFANPQTYTLYRTAVRRSYGVDLEDMNYFGIGQPGWGDRIPTLEKWMLMAAKYGDVTVAMEPSRAPDPYDVFRHSPEMSHLVRTFCALKDQGITVWLRYASEANDGTSDYNVVNDRQQAYRYFEKACWLRKVMPSNVKIVFCPLINLAVRPQHTEQDVILAMFEGRPSDRHRTLPWDCIGGTLYRTNLAVKESYDTYYQMMLRRMTAHHADLPFEVCELGGPFSRRSEITKFLQFAKDGRWKRLRKVNLFAHDINKHADPNAQFGYMDPKVRLKAIAEAQANGSPAYVDSWLKLVIAPKVAEHEVPGRGVEAAIIKSPPVIGHQVATSIPGLSPKANASTHTKPATPVFGALRLGAFSGEAAEVAGLVGTSIQDLADPSTYDLYRRSVKKAYGLDLEDMNYFGIGQSEWGTRIPALDQWILNAGRYGDVTIALEPMGKGDPYAVFRPSPEMNELRGVFERAKQSGIRIWLRFMSEANDGTSIYTAVHSREDAIDFYRKAQWFKGFVPSNVKLVFSPLINLAVLKRENERERIHWMFAGDESTTDMFEPWDCVGGTLYRTNLPLIPTYSTYHRMMVEECRLANLNIPFQLCELGGPYSRRAELISFLLLAKNGHWSGLRKINLFAHDINRRADPNAQFGYMNPKIRREAITTARKTGKPVFVGSWLKDLLAGSVR